MPPAPTAATITAQAALDRSTIGAFAGDFDRALRGRPDRVVVDLTAVESFDSAGLGGVVAGMRVARAAGVEVKLRGLSQPMLDLFSLVSVERLTAAAAGPPRVDAVTRLGEYVEPIFDGARAVFATAVEVIEAKGVYFE